MPSNESIISNGEMVLRMTMTDGWKLLKKDIDNLIEAGKESLLSVNPSRDNDLFERGKINGYKIILALVNDYIEDGKIAERENAGEEMNDKEPKEPIEHIITTRK